MQLKELGYDKHFFTNPSVKRYLENHSKDMMNGFWNEIKDKEKIEKLSKDLEREYEGPDHPFFPTGVFPDPTKKNKVWNTLNYSKNFIQLENPTFQDYYEYEMDPDGFEMFKDLFGDNDTLSYEVSADRGVILIYWMDERILDDLMYVVKKLGAEEVTVQKDRSIRLWFD